MLNKKVDFPDKLLIKGLKKKSHKIVGLYCKLINFAT